MDRLANKEIASVAACQSVAEQDQRQLVHVNRVTGTYEWALPRGEYHHGLESLGNLMRRVLYDHHAAVPYRAYSAFAERLRTFRERVRERIAVLEAADAAGEADDGDDDLAASGLGGGDLATQAKPTALGDLLRPLVPLSKPKEKPPPAAAAAPMAMQRPPRAPATQPAANARPTPRAVARPPTKRRRQGGGGAPRAGGAAAAAGEGEGGGDLSDILVGDGGAPAPFLIPSPVAGLGAAAAAARLGSPAAKRARTDAGAGAGAPLLLPSPTMPAGVPPSPPGGAEPAGALAGGFPSSPTLTPAAPGAAAFLGFPPSPP